MIHVPRYQIKLFIADVVCYSAALIVCWNLGWGYAFAGVGAFASVYLLKSIKKMIRVHRSLKQMHEDMLKVYEED